MTNDGHNILSDKYSISSIEQDQMLAFTNPTDKERHQVIEEIQNFHQRTLKAQAAKKEGKQALIEGDITCDYLR